MKSKNNTNIKAPNDPLINRGKNKKDSKTGITVSSVTGCPEYIVYRRLDGFWFFDSDGIFGFNNFNDANNFAAASNQVNNMTAATASYKDSSGNKITEDNYYNRLNTLKQTDSTYVVNGIETSDRQISCNELFDQSVIDLLNEILRYPRYIVPAIIIVLGTLDFFKAVTAGKEDEIKKAQRTFVKRVIAGVIVFLVPVLMNVIIYIANIAWEGLGYTTCNL